MSLLWSFVALLVFPGLIYALPMSWLLLWIERKVTARMQGRIGPPFYQPFWDFVKLMSKVPVRRNPVDAALMAGLPILAGGAVLGALALMPVFPNQGFAGDLVLLVGLLEVPPLCAVLAGYASRSIFGQVGSTREAILSIFHNLPFLAALVALAASVGSMQSGEVVSGAPVAVRIVAEIILIGCLPIKLRVNPFSVSNAEQEIYTGATTEYDGPRLALWELAHGLEWVALVGLVATIAVPVRTGNIVIDGLVFATVSLLLVLFITAVGAATARVKLPQAAAFYWRWGLAFSVLVLVLASVLPMWRL